MAAIYDGLQWLGLNWDRALMQARLRTLFAK
jgi:hypothetical protein